MVILDGIEQTAGIATLDGYHDVPSKDSTDNSQMRDVIGNKTDSYTGDSLYAENHTLPYILGVNMDQGWKCPQCKAVMSPKQKACINCFGSVACGNGVIITGMKIRNPDYPFHPTYNPAMYKVEYR